MLGIGTMYFLKGAGMLFWELLFRIVPSRRLNFKLEGMMISSIASSGLGLLITGLTVAIGYSSLYSGIDGDGFKGWYMSYAGLMIRFAVYVLIFIFIPWLLWRVGRNHLTEQGYVREEIKPRLRTVSAVCMPVFFMGFCSFALDWLMSRGFWESALWPLHLLVMAALFAMTSMIRQVVVATPPEEQPEREKAMLPAMGNCLLAFVLLHLYTCYSIGVVDWFSGEQMRGLGVIALLMGVLPSLLALVCLLFSSVKRNKKWLKIIAMCLNTCIIFELLFWMAAIPLSMEWVKNSKYLLAGVLAVSLLAQFAFYYFYCKRRENEQGGK